MRRVALLAIRAYQRYISPRKGFCCAYRVHTGHASCSNLGYRAIRMHGIAIGLALLQHRTRLCGIAHRRHIPARRIHHSGQRGVCDVGCDLPCDANCDVPGSCDCHQVSRYLTCCDCSGCDWPSKSNRKSSEREKYVYIPPKATFGKPPSGSGEQSGA